MKRKVEGILAKIQYAGKSSKENIKKHRKSQI